jgi:hypothetical protein
MNQKLGFHRVPPNGSSQQGVTSDAASHIMTQEEKLVCCSSNAGVSTLIHERLLPSSLYPRSRSDVPGTLRPIHPIQREPLVSFFSELKRREHHLRLRRQGGQ